LGSTPEEEYLKDLVVDRSIILKLFFKKEDWGVDVIVLAQACFFEHGYETLGCIRCGEFSVRGNIGV
jgi:hypothetical protein